MPGAASLAAGEYYAHPRNAFWPIMGALFGASPTLDYAERVTRLLRARVAVWDVLARCNRVGSADAAIADHGVIANDFDALLSRCAGIHTIYFNKVMAPVVIAH